MNLSLNHLDNKRYYIIFFILISFVVFANTLFFDFVWDDIHQIKYNELLKSYENIDDLFFSPIPDMPAYYRPMFMISLFIDYLIWGQNAAGFHLTNVLLNIFVTVLIFVLSEKLFDNRLIAIISTIVFTIHPTHSATVSYVSARNELLCGFFIIHAFLFYVKYRTEIRKKLYLFLSLIFYFLGLLSKEMAIIMPFLIFVYEISFFSGEIKNNVKLLIFFILTSAGYLILRSYFSELPSFDQFPLQARLATFSKVILYDIFILFFPFYHKVFYRIEILEGFTGLLPYVYLAGFILILLIAFMTYRRDKRLFFSLIWILLSLVPVTTIITFIYPSLIAERYLYIPSFGFAMFLGVLYTDIYNFIESRIVKYKKFSKTVFILLCIIFSVITFQRNFEYYDNVNLWAEAKEDEPYEPYVMDKLAQAYIEKKYYSNAEAELKRLQIADPNNPQVYHRLGNLYKRWEKFDLAEKYYLKALELNPEFDLAIDDLANLYKKLGKYDLALLIFSKSLKINPYQPNVLYEMAEILITKGDPFEAELLLEKALELDPNHHRVMVKLGDIFFATYRYELAAQMYQRALELDPENAEYKQKLESLK